jgi:septal ring factor EnvC (AmiA/AmiB activator)
MIELDRAKLELEQLLTELAKYEKQYTEAKKRMREFADDEKAFSDYLDQLDEQRNDLSLQIAAELEQLNREFEEAWVMINDSQ